MEKDCPTQMAQGKFIGQVYTLDAKKVKGNNELVVGTCYVNNHSLFMLVDNEATHYFISTKCLQQIGFEYIPLSNLMVINSTMSSNLVYINCKQKAISFMLNRLPQLT